jgi:hypothetical protein
MLPVSVCSYILGDVSVFKSAPLPVAGLFTATAWVWNVAIYTTFLI